MIDWNRSLLPSQFIVTVGLTRVTVSGVTRDEVIQQARRALCSELPRLYDVIRALDASRFLIAPAAPPHPEP